MNLQSFACLQSGPANVVAELAVVARALGLIHAHVHVFIEAIGTPAHTVHALAVVHFVSLLAVDVRAGRITWQATVPVDLR